MYREQLPIDTAKKNRWKVVLYGLGQLGRDNGIQLLNWIDLKPDFVCDKSVGAIDQFVLDNPNVEGMVLNDLLHIQQDILVLACVGVAYIREVCEMLRQNPCLHVLTIDDICAMDSVLEKFYHIKDISSKAQKSPANISLKDENGTTYLKGNRIAVFTCVTGGYDVIKEPTYTEEQCDYFLISDERPESLKVYHFLDVNQIVPENVTDNAAKNRWCKMHGYEIFKSYKYSIYIDGSIRLVKPISYYVDLIGASGIAVHRHSLRDCIYEEGLRLVANKRGNIDFQRLRDQMLGYLEEGMPRKYGLFECGVIVRKHNVPAGNQIMDQWFDEYMRGQRRDQLSFTYILWKNGVPADAVGILNHGNDIRENPDFTTNEEHGTKG